MKTEKREHDCTSSSDEDISYKKLKTSHKKHEKRRKRKYSSSSSSSSSFDASSESDSSTGSSLSESSVRKNKKSTKAKIRYKTKSRKDKKLKKSKKKKSHKEKKGLKPPKVLKTEKRVKQKSEKGAQSNDIPIDLMDKSMTPMTKEQWEKQQNVVKRVFDETTGRYRLIKGDGEVIEEIVSRDRHKQINQQATRGDGEYFQSNVKSLNSFK